MLPGMWPPRSPARGSGSAPVNRPGERRSTTCSDPRRERVAYRGEIPHLRPVEPGMESPARQRRPAALERAALAAPLEDASVQHGHALVPEDAEHPPHSSGAQVQAGAVVDDEIIGVVETECRHLFGEVVRGGKHVRQRRRPVACGIEIEKECARDVADRVLRGRGTPARGEIPRGVEHTKIGAAESRRQPFGGDERRQRLGHGISSTLPVVFRPSSASCASTARARGNSAPIRTFSVPSATQPSMSEARRTSSSRVAM